MKKLGPLEKGIVFQPTSNGLIARAVSDVAKSTTIEHKFKLLFAKFNCWRRLNLDSECRFFLDRGLAANIWLVGC